MENGPLTGMPRRGQGLATVRRPCRSENPCSSPSPASLAVDVPNSDTWSADCPVQPWRMKGLCRLFRDRCVRPGHCR